MRSSNLIISVVTAASALVSLAPAFAADLAPRTYTKAPPMAAAVYDWSGFYVGANGGYGSTRACFDFLGTVGTPLAAVRDNCGRATGGILGGQVGYNWQASAWVFGLEAQGDWSGMRGTAPSTINIPTAVTGKIQSFGLFTGRVGYAWNNVMVYAKGGAAVVSNSFTQFVIPTNAFFASTSDTRWGETVGVGFDYGFAPNWSVGIEYDHMFMGSRNDVLTGPTIALAASAVNRIGESVDIGTVHVNYRFGGPVVARY